MIKTFEDLPTLLKVGIVAFPLTIVTIILALVFLVFRPHEDLYLQVHESIPSQLSIGEIVHLDDLFESIEGRPRDIRFIGTSVRAGDEDFYFIGTGHQTVRIEFEDSQDILYEPFTFYVSATEDDIINNFTAGIGNMQVALHNEDGIWESIMIDPDIISYVDIDETQVDFGTIGRYPAVIALTPYPHLNISRRETPDLPRLPSPIQSDFFDREDDIIIVIVVEILPESEITIPPTTVPVETNDNDDRSPANTEPGSTQADNNSSNQQPPASSNLRPPTNTQRPPNNNNNQRPPDNRPPATRPPSGGGTGGAPSTQPPICTWVITQQAQPAIPPTYETVYTTTFVVAGNHFSSREEADAWNDANGGSHEITSETASHQEQTSPGRPAIPEQGHWVCE